MEYAPPISLNLDSKCSAIFVSLSFPQKLDTKHNYNLNKATNRPTTGQELCISLTLYCSC